MWKSFFVIISSFLLVELSSSLSQIDAENRITFTIFDDLGRCWRLFVVLNSFVKINIKIFQSWKNLEVQSNLLRSLRKSRDVQNHFHCSRMARLQEFVDFTVKGEVSEVSRWMCCDCELGFFR